MEWISDTSGYNWHRNVIFHENGAREFDIRRLGSPQALPLSQSMTRTTFIAVAFEARG